MAFGVVLMGPSSWSAKLEHVDSSYLLLATLAMLGSLAGVLYQVGIVGWVLRGLESIAEGAIKRGFLVWERLFSWASNSAFLAIAVGLLVAGALAGGLWPLARVFCGLATLSMGVVAVFAYMFIERERDEVERGYKSVHNPLKGQVLAMNLVRYGKQARIPLMISATVAVFGGFALFNEGLYETVGRGWYRVADPRLEPNYADFLAYSLTKVLGIVDVLDVFKSHHLLGAPTVRQGAWPASVLLGVFQLFFTLVLLHQIAALLRQGTLLTETITDFWSPHEPIHERARNALPTYGAVVIGPLLGSLRSIPLLTKEQREKLPLILETIGPSIIPGLVRHGNDSHEYVRSIVVAALGQLRALETAPLVAALARDPSEVVRASAVEALGLLGARQSGPARALPGRARDAARRRMERYFSWRKRQPPAPPRDPVEMAVSTLESALADLSPAVRIQAARALGRIGSSAAVVAPRLIGLLKEADETIRCEAATALGQVEGDVTSTVQALVDLLSEASAPVKTAAARALGAMKTGAAAAVPALVPLLQDGDESVRGAAALAIAELGPLSGSATGALVEGLSSPDNVVRAQTAEALGTIGASAEDAATALVRAAGDDNDRVRSKAVEALGKIGDSAATVAVPCLIRALRDQDNGIIALAAEALGQMGQSADGAIPALVRSLGHKSTEVRRGAAQALGELGVVAATARPALEKAAHDDDGAVRAQAIRALGAIGGSTPTPGAVGLAWLQDRDPVVRAAAVESLGRSSEPSEAMLQALMLLLDDANDQVKIEATKVLPNLLGPTPAVIDGLCRQLLGDDNDWVQVHAALALGKLGSAAAAAGGPLLRAAQTGEAGVREQAMRAIAKIQPPETAEAFVAGLKDSSGDVRTVASAGWMNAKSIPDQAIPALIEALRDPEVSVRANCAHALARLDVMPPAAIPSLIECTADANDGLRMNAAIALKNAPAPQVAEVMRRLLADPNSRVRLVAAGSLLAAETDDVDAAAVLVLALGDATRRVREAALEMISALGARGESFLKEYNAREGGQVDTETAIAQGGQIQTSLSNATG